MARAEGARRAARLPPRWFSFRKPGVLLVAEPYNRRLYHCVRPSKESAAPGTRPVLALRADACRRPPADKFDPR